jgi:hypothetical protein
MAVRVNDNCGLGTELTSTNYPVDAFLKVKIG